MKYFLKNHTALVSLALMFVAWWLVAEWGLVGQTLLAAPWEVWEIVNNAFKEDSKISERFHLHALETFSRAVYGWGLSLVIGVMSGLLIGSLTILYKGGEPVIEFFRSIPPVLLFPLFLVAFNFDERAYVWTIFFGCYPIVLLTVARASTSISKEKLKVVSVYNASILVKAIVYFMEILPSIFLGARVAFSIAIVISVVTEMVFTPASGLALGALARDAEMEFNTPLFYASIITVGILGYLGNLALRKCEELARGRSTA